MAKPPGSSAGKPPWMDYVDLGLKVVVPFAVLGGTVLFNHLLEQGRKADACIQSQRALIDFACGDKESACEPGPTRLNYIPEVVKLTALRCKDPLPPPLLTLVASVQGSGKDVNAVADLSRQAGAAPLAPQALSEGEAGKLMLAPSTGAVVAPGAGEGIAPRLYIQIKSESQRPAAERFRAAVNAATLNGQKLVAPGGSNSCRPAR